jgi:hypothetical protein
VRTSWCDQPVPLGTLREIAPHPPGIGERQPLEERVEIVIGAIMTGLRRDEIVPPCSAASRCSAPPGVFGDLNPPCIQPREPLAAGRKP